MLLVSVLARSDDVGPTSRARVSQLQAETRWLEQLLRAYEEDATEPPRPGSSPTRLDLLAREMLQPIQVESWGRIELEAVEVRAQVDRLALWRLLRNLIGNALAAAGSYGRVIVRVYRVGDDAVLEVDDDGPGLDPTRALGTSLGLSIVADLVQQWRGQMTIGRGSLNGCGVRLQFPADQAVSVAPRGVNEAV